MSAPGFSRTAARGFAAYARLHIFVARHRPGQLHIATERRLFEVCVAEECTREEYLERSREFCAAVLARHPQDVLDLGDEADALLVAYASKVAWERFVESRPASSRAA